MVLMEKNQQYIDALAHELVVGLAQNRMTRLDLARATEMHENTIGRYLSGRRDIPFSVMVELCRVLGLNIEDVDAAARAAIGE